MSIEAERCLQTLTNAFREPKWEKTGPEWPRVMLFVYSSAAEAQHNSQIAVWGIHVHNLVAGSRNKFIKLRIHPSQFCLRKTSGLSC